MATETWLQQLTAFANSSGAAAGIGVFGALAGVFFTWVLGRVDLREARVDALQDAYRSSRLDVYSAIILAMHGELKCLQVMHETHKEQSSVEERRTRYANAYDEFTRLSRDTLDQIEQARFIAGGHEYQLMLTQHREIGGVFSEYIKPEQWGGGRLFGDRLKQAQQNIWFQEGRLDVLRDELFRQLGSDGRLVAKRKPKLVRKVQTLVRYRRGKRHMPGL